MMAPQSQPSWPGKFVPGSQPRMESPRMQAASNTPTNLARDSPTGGPPRSALRHSPRSAVWHRKVKWQDLRQADARQGALESTPIARALAAHQKDSLHRRVPSTFPSSRRGAKGRELWPPSERQLGECTLPSPTRRGFWPPGTCASAHCLTRRGASLRLRAPQVPRNLLVATWRCLQRVQRARHPALLLSDTRRIARCPTRCRHAAHQTQRKTAAVPMPLARVLVGG